MRKKLVTLCILALAAALPPFAHAQRSASAAMEVSVKVIKSTNIVAISDTRLSIKKDDTVSGRLGSVTILDSAESDMLVTTQKKLELSNGEGEILILPVGVTKRSNNEDLEFKFEAGKTSLKQLSRSDRYDGTVTTQIEYL